VDCQSRPLSALYLHRPGACAVSLRSSDADAHAVDIFPAINVPVVSILATQQQDSANAVAGARDEEHIAVNRYRAGLVSYLNVVYAQQTLLNNQQAEAQVSGERLIATVVLVKALGGGWENRPHP
jgi:hypothetical protein